MRPPFFNAHWARSISQVEQDGTQFYAVRVARGGPWDGTRSLREQTGFEEHARFMDALVDDGFILLGAHSRTSVKSCT